MLVVPAPDQGARSWLGVREELLDTNSDTARTMDAFLAQAETRAFRMARYAVRDDDEALDIVQDAMFGLVRRYSDKAPEDWAPLFYRILQSRIRDWQRRRMVRNRVMVWSGRSPAEDERDPVEAMPDPYPSGPEESVGRNEAMEDLHRALEALPGRQREAFLLRAVEGLDVAQTAAAMGCSQGSVKTHYHRAVHSLRETLGEHWHE